MTECVGKVTYMTRQTDLVTKEEGEINILVKRRLVHKKFSVAGHLSRS